MKNDQKIETSIIIVTYNSSSTIGTCLKSIIRSGIDNCEIVIVDNASTDDTLSKCRETIDSETSSFGTGFHDRIRIIDLDKNTGYSKGCNIGAKGASGEYLVFMNPDVVVFPGWIDRLVVRFKKDITVGAVGPISNMVAGIQTIAAHSGKLNDFDQDKIDARALALEVFHVYKDQAVISQSLMGFCMAVRRDVFNEIGGFDEDLILGNDDLEFSLRMLNSRYRMVVALDTFVYHIGQVSYKSGPKIQTSYLGCQSNFILGEKLNEHFGLGKVPDTTIMWDNPIFEKEIVLQVIDAVILKDDDAVLDNSYIKAILTAIHFEFLFNFVGFSDEETILIKSAMADNEHYLSQQNNFFKDLISCIEKLENKFVLILPVGLQPRKYSVSYMRGALDATGADIVVPDQGILWDEEISSQIGEIAFTDKPIMFLERANLPKLNCGSKLITNAEELLAHLKEVTPSLKVVETKDARFRKNES